MLFQRALLTARTARHLRWEQLVYRPVRRIQRRLPVRLDPHVRSPDPGRLAALSAAAGAWWLGDDRVSTTIADAVLRGEFRFLNRTEVLANIDWSRRYVSHLWSYNLHYFDYGVDLAAAYRRTRNPVYRDRFVELLDGWIAGNRPGCGDGWEPYAVSLRLVNWLYGLLLLGDAVSGRVRERIERSAALQAEYLSRRLELHLLANHIQKNLKALLVAGLYLKGSSATGWFRAGVEGSWRELFEQVLPDGGHFERSPMYHAIALADFLELIDLLRAAGEPVPAAALERVRAMARAFGVLCRPDGQLHPFNDAAQGIAPDRRWLSRLGERVLGETIPEPLGCVPLPDTGYHAWIDPARGERLLVDCGPPGPDYQPGHAHCDMLSYELDLFGRPVIVDAGVSGYEGDPLREYVRSTRAHNTVVVDGREQSEVWGTFRLARRARALYGESSAAGGTFVFRGGCCPYHGRGVHYRTIERKSSSWCITDRVEHAAGARLESWLHFHPDCIVERSGEAVLVHVDSRTVRIEPFGTDGSALVRGESEPAQGWHCPEFGVALPAFALRFDIHANDGRAFGCRITPES